MAHSYLDSALFFYMTSQNVVDMEPLLKEYSVTEARLTIYDRIQSLIYLKKLLTLPVAVVTIRNYRQR